MTGLGPQFGMAEASTAVGAAAPLVSPFSAPVPPPALGSVPATLASSFVKSQAVGMTPGSPAFRSLSPVLPMSQESPARGAEICLTNVCVPLDAIKPSESWGEGPRLTSMRPTA